jgi:hypothetical protein
MIRCQLCGRKFKNKRGLYIHFARTHDVRGPHDRLSLKVVKEFFPLLKKRHWAKAERFLNLIVEKAGKDEWVNGYVHALNGMITALRIPYSPPHPYIVKLDEFDTKHLQEAKTRLNKLRDTLNNKSTFDAAYFQAWEDFIHYMLQQQAR